MNGLTAKVFRTYNASFTMANLLRDMKSTGTHAEKVVDYNEANRKVAILCNHKRTVAATHDTQIEKMDDRIKGLMYQKWRLKQMMIDVDPKIKKKKGSEYFELEEELDEEWVVKHLDFLVEEERQKIEKKFNKENEKLKNEGAKEMKPKELQERLEAADELEKKYRNEQKKGKVDAEGKGPTIEKYEANLEKLDQRINNMLMQRKDKDNNKEVALGTSKIVSPVLCFNFPTVLMDICRTTLTLVSLLSSRRNSGCPSKSSSPKRCARSLIGRSSLWRRTGNSEKRHRSGQ